MAENMVCAPSYEQYGLIAIIAPHTFRNCMYGRPVLLFTVICPTQQ